MTKTRSGSNSTTTPAQLAEQMAEYITADHGITPDETVTGLLLTYVYSKLAETVPGIKDTGNIVETGGRILSRLQELSVEKKLDPSFSRDLENYFEAAYSEAQEQRWRRSPATPHHG